MTTVEELIRAGELVATGRADALQAYDSVLKGQDSLTYRDARMALLGLCAWLSQAAYEVPGEAAEELDEASALADQAADRVRAAMAACETPEPWLPEPIRMYGP